MLATIAIKPSGAEGYVTTIRFADQSQLAYQKWYENDLDAIHEAERMGFVTGLTFTSTPARYLRNVRRELPQEIDTSARHLESYAFRPRFDS